MNAGTIQSLWRFPVKSFGGELLTEAVLSRQGLLGDRAYGLIDLATGRVVSAKSAKLFPDLLTCRAVYISPPQPGEPLPPVQMTLADGSIVRSDAPNVGRLLSAFFGRKVQLARMAPDGFTVDQYYPDLEGLDPTGHQNTVVATHLGTALFASMNVPSPVPPGSFMDCFPYSLITTSTLQTLSQLSPLTDFDPRRFRMNIVLSTVERHSTHTSFIENTWVDSSLWIGQQIRLAVAMPTPRCVMTMLPQPGLLANPQVLRELVKHNQLNILGTGLFPCAGVYATLEQGKGTVRVGDELVLML